MKIVGITACPTGIAHTYLAQEALEKAAKEKGYEIKVETQGSIGIENELTQAEIDEADLVIFAVGIMVEGEERFDDKKIIKVKLNEVISKAGKIIEDSIKTLV